MPSSDSSITTLRLTVGIVLTFLGVALLPHGPSGVGWLAFGAALGVTLIGLGLLLRVILQNT